MEKMGVVMRMERKGSCAVCFEAGEPPGSDEPTTQKCPDGLLCPLPSSAILSLLQGVLPLGTSLILS